MFYIYTALQRTLRFGLNYQATKWPEMMNFAGIFKAVVEHNE